ncbi:MaoC family dehydratase [Natronomonas salsuginis]|uniref:MaoC family dehydratase n=1 Tax=Natronomonas salsuginis TaxID=2217661 RepID=A0A4U5JC32_9EURY|nr:MaoC family dehydratase [Natronomonas salsuginis]TKR26175.1 MaoC family dehydratase [Natronomonas salsuginis]
MTKYYEDLSVGDRFRFGEYDVTDEEIRAFAGKYDPQPFHLDAEAAADSVFGELVASGWHTASISMRLLVDHAFDDIAIMGGRGIDDLRWHRPIYPGETLSGAAEVVAKPEDGLRDTRGNVDFEITITKPDGSVAMSYVTLSMVRRRGAP